MELKAITYCYIQDGVVCNRVVGIYEPDRLDEAMNEIRLGFGKDKIVKEYTFDKSCNNYFLEYEDEENSHFYTGDYNLNRLQF